MAASLLPAQREHSTRLLRSSVPLKLSRDLREIPVERYRLQEDGRKWKAIARDRMALAEWLATHGDADGTRIYPSVESMARHFGWSRAKTFYLLADLKELQLLESTPHFHGERGTRIRRMNLPAFLRTEVQHSLAEVQDSQNLQKAEVQDSRAGVQSNVGHNRHPTDTKNNPPYPPAAAGGNAVPSRPPVRAPNRFFFTCRGGLVIEVFVPIGRKLWRNEKKYQSFQSHTGADDIRGPNADAVMEYFKLQGFQVGVVESPPQTAGAKSKAVGQG